jgi:hypothetical protein
MNKVIAISENSEEHSVLGLVVEEPLCKLAINSLSAIGFKEVTDFKLTTDNIVMKSDVFHPNMLNEFSLYSCIDYFSFAFFTCHKEGLISMLILIDK